MALSCPVSLKVMQRMQGRVREMTGSIIEDSQPLTHTCLSGVHPLNSAASGTLLNVFLMPAGSRLGINYSAHAQLQA